MDAGRRWWPVAVLAFVVVAAIVAYPLLTTPRTGAPTSPPVAASPSNAAPPVSPTAAPTATTTPEPTPRPPPAPTPVPLAPADQQVLRIYCCATDPRSLRPQMANGSDEISIINSIQRGLLYLDA